MIGMNAADLEQIIGRELGYLSLDSDFSAETADKLKEAFSNLATSVATAIEENNRKVEEQLRIAGIEI